MHITFVQCCLLLILPKEDTQPAYLGNVTQLHDHAKVGLRGSSNV
jgi:hypothetical protein